jgi:anti-sigma B factor antagonist
MRPSPNQVRSAPGRVGRPWTGSTAGILGLAVMRLPAGRGAASGGETESDIRRRVRDDHWRYEPRRVQTLPLLLMRKGDPEMVSVESSTREGDGPVVVVLRGELDVVAAAKVAASLAVVAASGRTVIVDLEGLEFIDSSGLAALVRARQHARRAGCDLLLAAPQQQVLRVLAITRLLDAFAVHTCVDEAAGLAGRIPVAIAPAAGIPVMLAMTSPAPGGLLAAGGAA